MTEQTEGHGTMIKDEPDEHPRGRLSLMHERDRAERQLAARLGEAFPHWHIMWGAWSRQYWAFPLFRAPRGTIAHSADPGDVAAQMRQVQAAIAGGGR